MKTIKLFAILALAAAFTPGAVVAMEWQGGAAASLWGIGPELEAELLPSLSLRLKAQSSWNFENQELDLSARFFPLALGRDARQSLAPGLCLGFGAESVPNSARFAAMPLFETGLCLEWRLRRLAFGAEALYRLGSGMSRLDKKTKTGEAQYYGDYHAAPFDIGLSISYRF